MKRTFIHRGLASIIFLGIAASQSAPQSTAIYKPDSPAITQPPAGYVSRTTKAVNYRRANGFTKVDLQGTELLQGASAEVKVESKNNRMEIEAKFEGLNDATKFGLEYLTYILWAVSPQGRAENLGELTLKRAAAGEVKAITDMQTFGMIVTAEPYFAVTQPGDTVVFENEDRTLGRRKGH